MQTNNVLPDLFPGCSLCKYNKIPLLLPAAPQICNYHMPTAIRVSPSLDSFKRHLKTHYFASP